MAKLSKLWFNNLLETNPVPTIWITNQVDGIDPAFLRRFMYAVEFSPLGIRQRARVLARHLGDGAGANIAPEDINTLATQYRVEPAQIATAVSAARLLATDARPIVRRSSPFSHHSRNWFIEPARRSALDSTAATTTSPC